MGKGLVLWRRRTGGRRRAAALLLAACWRPGVAVRAAAGAGVGGGGQAALALAERAAPGFAARLQALEAENFRLRSALAAGAADAAENEAAARAAGQRGAACGQLAAGAGDRTRGGRPPNTGRRAGPRHAGAGQPGAAGGHRGRKRRAQRHGRPARAGGPGLWPRRPGPAAACWRAAAGGCGWTACPAAAA